MNGKSEARIREARQALFGADVEIMAELERGRKLAPAEYQEDIARQRGAVLAAISVLDGMGLD